MVTYNLICKSCGEDTTYADKERFIAAVKAHPKGHDTRLKANSVSMNQEELDKVMIEILQRVKK